MPFLSQDWRGPGEDWVRGQDGWEIMRRGEARDKVMEEKDMVKEDVEEGEEEGREGGKRRRTKTEGDKENTAPGR